MPVKSYLAQAFEDKKEALLQALSRLPYCESYAAENADVVVLVTDTPDDQEDRNLQDHLHAIPELKDLSMVSGFMSHQE